MPEPTNLDAITTWCHTCARPVSMPHEHGDAPPTPTVIASDIALAEKWFRSSSGDLVSRKAAIASMAAEIAADREAWGVPREAVAALVEGAARCAHGAKPPAVANLWVIVDAQMHPNIQGGVSALTTAIVQLRAALGRVKGVG